MNILEQRNGVSKIIALVMLFFGTNLYLSFATDTYATLSAGFYHAGIDMATRNGRPVIGLIYELQYLSGLPNVSFYYISSVLALIFLALSIWIYQGILKKHGIKENTRILLAFAAIANIFIIEYFMFVEKCGFMLAILFDVIGIYWLDKFFDERQKKHFGFAVISMIFAIMTYQGTIALFVILSIPLALKYANDFKTYIFNGLSIGLIYTIPVIIDLLAFKFIFKSARIAEKTDYIKAIKNVVKGIYHNGIWTFNILPNYLYLILVIIIFAVLVIHARGGQKSRLKIVNAFVIVGAACLFSSATIFQGSGWWSTRTVYPIASIAAALAIDLFVNGTAIDTGNWRRKAGYMVSIGAIATLLIFQYFSFNRIYIDKYQVNALDQYRYQYIGQAIEEYQKSTGEKITKVAFYDDAKKSRVQYSDLYGVGDLVVSTFVTDWSDVNAMNYYLHTHYDKIKPVEKYKAYFSKKNWSHLSKEQLIFDGDKLHICVY